MGPNLNEHTGQEWPALLPLATAMGPAPAPPWDLAGLSPFPDACISSQEWGVTLHLGGPGCKVGAEYGMDSADEALEPVTAAGMAP